MTKKKVSKAKSAPTYRRISDEEFVMRMRRLEIRAATANVRIIEAKAASHELEYIVNSRLVHRDDPKDVDDDRNMN